MRFLMSAAPSLLLTGLLPYWVTPALCRQQGSFDTVHPLMLPGTDPGYTMKAEGI